MGLAPARSRDLGSSMKALKASLCFKKHRYSQGLKLYYSPPAIGLLDDGYNMLSNFYDTHSLEEVD